MASAAKGRRPTALTEPDMAKLRKHVEAGDKKGVASLLDEAGAREEEEVDDKDKDKEMDGESELD
eukprot:3539873-Pyramimonas_sp.AAC.1